MKNIFTGIEMSANDEFDYVIGIGFISFGIMAFMASIIKWNIGWFIMGMILFAIGFILAAIGLRGATPA